MNVQKALDEAQIQIKKGEIKMALYRINHPATGRVVNLYISSSTGSVPHGTPLSLYPWQNNSDQKFEMEYRGDYVIFRLQRDIS